MNFKENKKILIVFTFLVAIFMALVIYLSYFTIFKAPNIVNHSANRRQLLKEESIKRGTIYDRDGEVLAYTDGEKGSYKRNYTYPTIYTHALGYYSKIVGKTGIESKYDEYLSGRKGSHTIKSIKAFFDKSIDPNVGDSVTMTTNTNIQQKSRDLLDENATQGAIVAMNPKTGEILSMVSYPDFNLQNIDMDLKAIQEKQEDNFSNKTISSIYTPGSTFKIITTASILESGIDQNYKDTGEESSFGGKPIKNANNKAYGDLNLSSAFTYSVNTYFANKAVKVGNKKLGETAEKFMFNKEIPFDLNVAKSKFNYSELSGRALAESAIGQGNIMATPLEMCLIASAIANEGNIMKPYLVSKVVSSDGNVVMERTPEVLSEATSAENAEKIKNMMVSVINKGSGKSAAIRSAQIAGKTGTAEVGKDKNHAWFVGFAPAEDPQICVAIVILNVEEFGSEVAGPVAKELIDYSLKQINQ